MSRIDSWHRKISTGRHFQNGHHNTAQILHCSISTSWINFRHRKMSTVLHFQYGYHNTAKIQHCSISKVAFDLFLYPRSTKGEGGILFYLCLSVLPSIQDIFRRIFGPVRFLLPVCRLCWFLYTLKIYAHFSSHFSQQLLMAEIWYLVTSFI